MVHVINLDAQPPADSETDGAEGPPVADDLSPPFGIIPASVLAACAGGAMALWWHRSRHRRTFGAIDGDDAEMAMVKPRAGRDMKKKGKGKGRRRREEVAAADEEIIE